VKGEDLVEDNSGEDNSGEDNSVEDNPVEDNPVEDNPGVDNPGEDNPGVDNPGEDSLEEEGSSPEEGSIPEEEEDKLLDRLAVEVDMHQAVQEHQAGEQRLEVGMHQEQEQEQEHQAGERKLDMRQVVGEDKALAVVVDKVLVEQEHQLAQEERKALQVVK